MKKSATYDELVKILQNVTSKDFSSLMSFYFALNPTKFDEKILFLLKTIAFDEEANRKNIKSDDAVYQKLIDYFKNYSK